MWNFLWNHRKLLLLMLLTITLCWLSLAKMSLRSTISLSCSIIKYLLHCEILAFLKTLELRLVVMVWFGMRILILANMNSGRMEWVVQIGILLHLRQVMWRSKKVYWLCKISFLPPLRIIFPSKVYTSFFVSVNPHLKLWMQINCLEYYQVRKPYF